MLSMLSPSKFPQGHALIYPLSIDPAQLSIDAARFGHGNPSRGD
jgi:hypothetical protein